MRTASNKEREEALAVFRSMHCVVDPHASGTVALEDGSHEHETFQRHRPSTADKDRHTEYRANKDADGKALSSDQALEMGRRMDRERKRMEKENRLRVRARAAGGKGGEGPRKGGAPRRPAKVACVSARAYVRAQSDRRSCCISRSKGFPLEPRAGSVERARVR